MASAPDDLEAVLRPTSIHRMVCLASQIRRPESIVSGKLTATPFWWFAWLHPARKRTPKATFFFSSIRLDSRSLKTSRATSRNECLSREADRSALRYRYAKCVGAVENEVGRGVGRDRESCEILARVSAGLAAWRLVLPSRRRPPRATGRRSCGTRSSRSSSQLRRMRRPQRISFPLWKLPNEPPPRGKNRNAHTSAKVVQDNQLCPNKTIL